MTEKTIRDIVSKCKTEKAVLAALKAHRVRYEDGRAKGDCDYFNIRIPCNDGIVRVYKTRGVLTVQHMRTVTVDYSGIPTFFATDSVF